MPTYDLRVGEGINMIRLTDQDNTIRIAIEGNSQVVVFDFETFHHFMHLAETAHAIMATRHCEECNAKLTDNEEHDHDRHH
jgi:Tfp pilus assembly ATPase PilU